MKKLVREKLTTAYNTMTSDIDRAEGLLLYGCTTLFRFNLKAFDAYKMFSEELRWVWENGDITEDEYFRFAEKAMDAYNKRQRAALTAWKKAMHS
jgi:hypothetical protein